MSDTRITRRQALLGLGGLITVGYGSKGCSTDGDPGSPMNAAGADAGGGNPDADRDASVAEDSGGPAPGGLLSGIESIVVLMMENRSFDHYLGSLKQDLMYGQAGSVDGLTGTESNPDPSGNLVKVFKMSNFTPEDPPHSWDKSRVQFGMGKNDGFVTAHAGASQNEAMGFHDRSQIPFYYWLADNFTICDRWHCSVMGPTWPNRYYLHACSSGGKKDNKWDFNPGPTTLWSRMKDAGKTFKNYQTGIVAWYTGGFLGQIPQLNPVVPIADFYNDAKNGTLPNFSIIDPDFQGADDHPSHDILQGQVFVASIYKALADSPQWGKTLFVIIYDENGGFYDHVPPGKVKDDIPDFEQLGFRIPAFVIGGMVKKGFANNKLFDHCSVGATLATRFGIKSLNQRMDAANDLSSCIDPALVKAPAPPPPGMPAPPMKWKDALERVGPWSQPELADMIERRIIPRSLVDTRSSRELTAQWLTHAHRLGVVRMQ